MSQNTSLRGEIKWPGTINLVSVAHALAIAEHLSFRSAAKALAIRHGSLIRRIRALEYRLGVMLFEGVPPGSELRTPETISSSTHVQRLSSLMRPHAPLGQRAAAKPARQRPYSIIDRHRFSSGAAPDLLAALSRCKHSI